MILLPSFHSTQDRIEAPWTYGAIFIILSGVLIFFWLQFPGVGIGDAASYVCSAQNITKQGFFPGEWYASGFGFSLLIAGVHAFGLDWELAARLLTLLFGLASIPLSGCVLAHFFNDRRAYFFVLPFFLLFAFWEHTVLGYVGGILLFFLLLSLALLYFNRVSLPGKNNIGFAAILFGFSLWVRASSLFFLPYFLWSRHTLSSTRKRFFLISLFFLLVFLFLSVFNLRDDTSLKYLLLSDYVYSFFPNVMYHFFSLAHLLPFFLPFMVLAPLALEKKIYHDLLLWSVPYIFLLAFFPLGQNLYYLFPLLPFWIVAAFKGIEWALRKLRTHEVHTSFFLGGLLLLQCLWLLPSLGGIPPLASTYQNFHAGFNYVEEILPPDALIIMGRESEIAAVKWRNGVYCGHKTRPNILSYPYTVSALFNRKDMRVHQAAEAMRIENARTENRAIFVSSQAYWFKDHGWCPRLGCIPLPSPENTIFHRGTYSLYRVS